MRIGELAAATGASTRALRYYEQQGLLTPHRSGNGYRDYPSEAITRVRDIRLLLDSGLTSEDVRAIADCLGQGLEGEPGCGEAAELYRGRLRAVRRRIAALQQVGERLEEHLAAMGG
ncbi:MerR family transcriptional regulator [Nocardiopsis halophila]|uniref:MerR family transcriptional regulator n=1 Tax=Nocardiopsis halophila TaxID=141692 RepID=UPI000346A11D|nr:MerR family transcriptional regulator [Nocardiopsis halophila]